MTMTWNDMPLTAHSEDGSLIGVHYAPLSQSSVHEAVSSTSSSVIRCYDGQASSGSLKFTLRVPAGDPLRKLLFASTKFLCGLRSRSVLVWDLDRGVLAHTVDIAYKSRSGTHATDSHDGILFDMATHSHRLYALVSFASSSHVAKCRVFQYDLSSSSATLQRKIKVGSIQDSTATVTGHSDSDSLAMDISPHGTQMAIRINNCLRVWDLMGQKIAKVHLPLENQNASLDNTTTSIPLVRYSTNGSYIALTTNTDNHRVLLFSISQNTLEKKAKMIPMGILKLSSDSLITNLDISQWENLNTDANASGSTTFVLKILVFQPMYGASFFHLSKTESELSSMESTVPLLPNATLQCHTKHDTLDYSSFMIHAGFRTQKKEILLLFRNYSHAPGSGATLPMEVVTFDNTANSLSGTVYVGESHSHNELTSTKKRKTSSDTNVALTSGDQGQEASLATDLTSGGAAAMKKIKPSFNENDEDDNGERKDDQEDHFQLEMDTIADQGQTIAERLAMLSSAMEQTDDEDEYDHDLKKDVVETRDLVSHPSTKTKFDFKSATSESLTSLLTQALSSNDSVQLNIALQMTDRRIVMNTVQSLQALDAQRDSQNDSQIEGYIPMLMGHIVRRMARRHTLVMPLGVWVKAILVSVTQSTSKRILTGSNSTDAEEERMALEGRELALKLGPLRNFLNERVDCFPQLLRLEGRLTLLSQQL